MDMHGRVLVLVQRAHIHGIAKRPYAYTSPPVPLLACLHGSSLSHAHIDGVYPNTSKRVHSATPAAAVMADAQRLTLSLESRLNPEVRRIAAPPG